MRWSALARLLFVGGVAYCAYMLRPLGGGPALNLAFSLALAGLIIYLEERLHQTSLANVFGALLGGACGLLVARLLGAALFWANTGDTRVVFLHSLILLMLPYIGLVLGGRSGEWLQPERLAGMFRPQAPVRRYRILDTSVIIDGRIADICETGFVDGTLVVPQFVLKELQQVADSADSLRRNRGRRGLDILAQMQKDSSTPVEIVDDDVPDVSEVDAKLITLAQARSKAILTNDFNLNRVAELQGIRVLNINSLANAVKPAVLPGEELRVRVIQEGKEAGQGVGFLDDGTMIVVEGGVRYIDKDLDVAVTRVLQTVAGRMIFAQPRLD